MPILLLLNCSNLKKVTKVIICCVISNLTTEHVHKYEGVLWTLEKLRKTSFCYKMSKFFIKRVETFRKLAFYCHQKQPSGCVFQYRCSALIVKFFEKLLCQGAIFSKLAL